MRRYGRLTLLAAMALMIPVSAQAAEPEKFGGSPAYEALAKLAVLHQGRIKPFDTLAREQVKQIYGRETIKLMDHRNEVIATWTPVAALLDWSIRPDFWDQEAFILVEYVPLKRLILSEEISKRLSKIAENPATSEPARAGLKGLIADPSLNASTVRSFLKTANLSKADEAEVETISAMLSEEHKWLTPRQLEEASITEGEGPAQPFNAWFRGVVQKKREADESPNGSIKLTEVEKRAYEVGTRLVHYQAARDRALRSVEPLLIMPRPINAAYLAYLAKTYEKAREVGVSGLSSLELDAAKSLDTFWNDIPIEDRAIPGTKPEFDREFTAWLRDASAWVPLRTFLDSTTEALADAGYPSDKAAAFVETFKALERAEEESPGKVGEAKANAFVAAARALGEAANPTVYPSVAAVERETTFNESNPFWLAWPTYALAMMLLAGCLGFMNFERRSFLGVFGRGMYSLGLLALLGAIGLEILGFYYRVRITGWAPVTNMYETVVWVSLVAAVLGVIFEAVRPKVYAALAGSGVAFLGTLLAANVPLLDPNIKALQPVLRSNYWLTIHVITEVSSYAAFLMAAGLGLIGTFYYLTATYRRSPSFTFLALPLAPGLPLLAVGMLGMSACAGDFGPEYAVGESAFYLFGTLAWAGVVLTTAAVVAPLGEMMARLTFRESALEAVADNLRLTAAGSARHAEASAHQAAGGSGSGGVATMAKPTVAEIRAMSSQPALPVDARTRAMQDTAAKIKPLANFIYRTMQVGVLLIAAGTILGGVWADYSWGRFWGWDPKEVWALITLLVYLVPLHGRFAGWFNTFWLVSASVVCSLSVIMAWYGVNFILGVGLHSYGFVEGGGQFSVFAVLGAMVALPLAAAWRRHLGRSPNVAA